MLINSFLTAALRDGWHRRVRSLLVGCSGGADSTALLHVLRQTAPALGLGLRVLHVHHGLRGAEADGDAFFVEALAARLGLPFECARVDTPARVRATGESAEQAARHLRLAAFRERLEASGGDAVAVAHHLDDQAETLWMKILQGVSPAGLGGMKVLSTVAGVPLLRPLLAQTSAGLRAFLSAHRLPWREDRMNWDPAHLRSRIRQELTPVLRALNPLAAEHAAALARASALDEAWIAPLVEETLGRVANDRGLDLALLAALPAGMRRRVLHRWGLERGLSFRALGASGLDRLDGLARKGRGAFRAGARLVRVEAGVLCLVDPPPSPAGTLQPPGVLDLPGGTLAATLESGYRVAGPGEAWLSAARVDGETLTVRAWRPGDRYRPHRAPGRRKLQDLFADARIPRSRRAGVPVVECRGEIVWVAGLRVAHDWAVGGPDEPSIHLVYL